MQHLVLLVINVINGSADRESEKWRSLADWAAASLAPRVPQPAGGMDPTMLAMIFRMMQGGGGGMPGMGGGALSPGGPQLPTPPQVGTAFHVGAPPLGTGPQQGNPMLTQLMQNPQLLQQLMSMLAPGAPEA